ncbi:MAG: beta-galactosidase, partial [Pyrinomonas methylaliphatogenes]|nr:beta-galactosidase [Pyrinomonas methylaliphatogenes]
MIASGRIIKSALRLIFVVACATAVSFAASPPRRKFNFNVDWKVWVGDLPNAADPNFDDSKWRTVTLPYAWNEDDAFRKDIKDLPTGIAWYRKHFKLPERFRGKKIFLEFEGIRQAGDFYLNGQHIGLSENGVMAFGFDITDYVKFGGEENVLAARIDNDWNYRERATRTKFQWQDRNFNANYGGIVKNVYLHVTERLYQTLPLYSSLGTVGVYIYADDFAIPKGEATIHAESQIKNEEDVTREVQFEVELLDLDGKLVARFAGERIAIAPGEVKIVRAASRISGLRFWSWGYGYLYTVRTILLVNERPVDVVETKTGFRKTEFKDGMLYLNDRAIHIHGYAQRSTNEWPAVGSAVPAWLSDYSNGLMVEGNANLVRWMHVTPWKQDIESCDRVGLMEAMPAGDAESDVSGVQWEQRKALMRDAIIYNRNNPSIIFYECGNKGISEEHMREMKEIRDLYDPHGGRAIGAREMLDSKVAEYGGEMLYVNKSATRPLWAMEYSRDEGLRKYWDDFTPPYHKDGDGPPYNGQPAQAYNRNMESHAVEDVLRWYDYWEQRPGTGKRVNAGGVNIIFSDTNTHHRGSENYRTSGEVDAVRIKKQNFYANQVMWDGWVDVERPRIHIIGHWNYRPGVVKDVYV